MNKKMIMPYALALVFVSSPAFAEDCGKGQDSCQQVKTVKNDFTTAAEKQSVKTDGKAKSAKAAARKAAKEEVGKEAACPVMGDPFKVTAKSHSASYKGKVYFFCCPGCSEPFLKNPEKYLQVKKEPLAAAYACPMGCAEGDKPGKCPKCGMDLAEKK